jgi:hypothetical protein
MERTKTTPTPPALQEFDEKTQKRRRRCRNALRRFLATSVKIGRIFASDFNGVHPQGVQWDSLQSFKLLPWVQVVDTRHCAPFLSAQHWLLYYMYCIYIIYILYITFYNICENQVRTEEGYAKNATAQK